MGSTTWGSRGPFNVDWYIRGSPIADKRMRNVPEFQTPKALKRCTGFERHGRIHDRMHVGARRPASQVDALKPAMLKRMVNNSQLGLQ